MFEALLLIAIIGGIAHLASLNQRLKRLEEDVADLNAFSTSRFYAPASHSTAPELAEELPDAGFEAPEGETVTSELLADEPPPAPIEQIFAEEDQAPDRVAESATVDREAAPATTFSFEEL